jgi:Polyketide cyclase / dehydrase and lipid transport
MTIRLERARSYPSPRDRAFAYITDPRNRPDYWPDLVAVEDPGQSRWRDPGDTMRLRMRLLGRETTLLMTLDRLEPGSLVTYGSVQPGLPDARHERHFEPSAGGFTYRLVVTYAARPGPAGWLDRTVVRRGIDRALRRTLDNLDGRLGALSPRL